MAAKTEIPPELLEASRDVDGIVTFNPAGTRAMLIVPDTDSPAAQRLDKRWRHVEMLARRLNDMPEIRSLSAEATRYLNHLIIWLSAQSQFQDKAQRRREREDWIGEMQRYGERASNAANKLHDKPGGSRDKAAQIRASWATGKYTNRDRCAEEECGALNMSFSAARKALRNTPEPKPNA